VGGGKIYLKKKCQIKFDSRFKKYNQGSDLKNARTDLASTIDFCDHCSKSFVKLPIFKVFLKILGLKLMS
jgi:hypothetical protein